MLLFYRLRMIKKLKDYILLKLGITRINKRLDYLSSYINLTYPEAIPIDPMLMAGVLQRLKEKNAVEGFNPIIHKNDIMFAFSMFNLSYHQPQAVYSYFFIGAMTVNNLKGILNKNSISPQRILDFGSGYGRVSRFFPKIFPDAEVSVSEVKKQALDFQQKSFNFKTIHHTQDAGTFPEEKFDFILALSVFTHLPQTSFEAWMTKLVESLNPNGAMVFTFFSDDQFRGGTTGKDFAYVQQSEDTLLSFMSDSIRNTSDYGETYISPNYLKNLLDSLNTTYTFLTKEEFGDHKGVLVRRK